MTPEVESLERSPLSLPARMGFRFAFVYLVLYCSNSSLVALIPILPQVLAGLWINASEWAAVHVFHLSGPVTQYHQTGSGDTTLAYVQFFLMVVLAMGSAAIWSLFDRHRSNYKAASCMAAPAGALFPRICAAHLRVYQGVSPSVHLSGFRQAHRNLRRIVANGIVVDVFGRLHRIPDFRGSHGSLCGNVASLSPDRHGRRADGGQGHAERRYAELLLRRFCEALLLTPAFAVSIPDPS